MNAGWYFQAVCVETALACGLLIGIERGFDLRQLRSGTRVAGVRAAPFGDGISERTAERKSPRNVAVPRAKHLVEHSGIEPETSAMPLRRSPS